MITLTGSIQFTCTTLDELHTLEAEALAQPIYSNVVVDELNLTISMDVNSTTG